MPTPGKSLFGFLDEPHALGYLRGSCVFPGQMSDAQLTDIWNQARAQLGAPVINAGTPDIQPISAAYQPHIDQLKNSPWIVANQLSGWQYAMVEIDPLIAYQFSIGIQRSAHHCTPLSSPPTTQQLMDACLPINPPADPYHITPAAQSMLITSKSLNMTGLHRGLIAQNAIGLVFGPTVPLAHVTRYNGRCYLHNGFHRTYGARIAGATHIPCVLRDAVSPQDAGITDNGGTFNLSLVESNNPPTLAHYTRGSAYDVQLRIFTRSLHISWAEYAVPEE